MSIYNMRHLPQVVYANPAFIPLARLNISIPYLGSNSAHLGKSDFTLNIEYNTVNGESRLDSEKFLEGLNDNNLVYSNISIEDLYIGFTIKNNYFFLTANDKVSADFNFPRDMAYFITEVNQDLGFPISGRLENIGLHYTHYREYGLGWSKKINDKVSVGARFKVLAGLISAQSLTSGVFEDGTSGKDISGMVDVSIRTSGIENYQDEIRNISNIEDFLKSPFVGFTGMNNLGYGLDLGIDYRINQKLKVSASAIDLFSKIEWQTNVKNYIAESVPVEFNTTSWDSIIDLTNRGNGLSTFLDSIQKNTDPTLAQKTYSTIVPTKVMASFTYYLTPKLEATILGQGEFTNNYFTPRLRIGIQGRFKRFINYMLTYSIIDERASVKNLGAGLVLNLGPVQIYGMIDDVFDPFLFKNSFNPSLRFGLNLTFGRDYE